MGRQRLIRVVVAAVQGSDPPLVENRQMLSKALGFERVANRQGAQGSSFSFSPEEAAEPTRTPQFSLWGQRPSPPSVDNRTVWPCMGTRAPPWQGRTGAPGRGRLALHSPIRLGFPPR